MKKLRTGQRILWTFAAVLAVLTAVLRPVPGIRFSSGLCLFACLVVALYALLDAFSTEHRWAKWCKGILLVLFCAGFAFFCTLEARVIAGSRGDSAPRDVSCVVILGAGVDGMQPSLMLKSRLDAALTYLADKPDVPVIVTGCQGERELISEAECMERYLTAHGIPASRIWKEEQATSTHTNFEYSLALMREHGIDETQPFAVVTSDYHIARARYIAGGEGVPPERMAAVPSALPRSFYYAGLTANYFIREAFALANEMVLGVDWDL